MKEEGLHYLLGPPSFPYSQSARAEALLHNRGQEKEQSMADRDQGLSITFFGFLGELSYGTPGAGVVLEGFKYLRSF